MKISNSKKELARIISENGGWHKLANLAFYGNFTGECLMLSTDEYPIYDPATKVFYINERDVVRSFKSQKFKNWHQTILSRAEYFHLYPATDAKTELCESVTRSIPEPEAKPTIEQLASDYRNAKEYADLKRQEADAAKVDAEAKLAELVAAGKAHWLVLSVAGVEPEPVITDWRDLRFGDVIRCLGDWQGERTDGVEYEVSDIERPQYDGELAIMVEIPDVGFTWGKEFEFIRRP